MHIHDEIVVDFDLDPAEWADYGTGMKLLQELVRLNTVVFHDRVLGRVYDPERLRAAVQATFIPLIERGKLWWENGYACVDVENLESMICIRELAKEP